MSLSIILGGCTFQSDNSISRADTTGFESDLNLNSTVSFDLCNVKDFGAAGDGITDDTRAIQKAANEAREYDKVLFIPGGNYLITSRVEIYTSVECHGKLLAENNGGITSIVIARTAKGTNLSPYTLSGLDRGSTQINGLNGYAGGTILFQSSEELIRRYSDGTVSSYGKNDASEIIDDYGGISPGLDCSYTDRSQLTVTAYPYEEPITINGLNVELTSNDSGDAQIIKCIRSNVAFNNLFINNTSYESSEICGIIVFNCVNVAINNPTMTNFHGYGDIYGIALSVASKINIYQGDINGGFTHAITGRHSKDIVINGGYYKGVDNHWGNNFLVENATIESDKGVSYAGTDITIRNCNIIRCVSILTLREDTPELMGNVVIDNIKVDQPLYWWGTFCYRATYGNRVVDYGRDLSVPDSVLITNVLVEMPDNYYLYHDEIFNPYWPQYSGKIYTTNIQTVGGFGHILDCYQF